MSLDLHSAPAAEPAGYKAIGLRANWSERVVTVVAVSIAVLIVAIFAVVMGMA